MTQITQEQVLERLDKLPRSLKEALFSVEVADKVLEISKNQKLTEEQADKFSTIISDILFGFINYKNLEQKLIDIIQIDGNIAGLITKDTEIKVFAPLKYDLNKVYGHFNPDSNEGTQSTKRISLDILDEEKNKKDNDSEKPLVLHVEKTFAPEEKPKATFKGFSLPFKFFKSKQTQEPIRADVETSLTLEKNEMTKKINPVPDKKRVVHYSEFRTPLTPFGETGEIVDLEKLAKKDELFPAIQKIPEEINKAHEEKPVTATVPALNTEEKITKQNIIDTNPTEKPSKNPWSFNLFKKPEQKPETFETKTDETQPKIDGNTIDLRKQ